MSIADRLIELRENHGYSKAFVCEQTGIPYTSYIKYEKRERELSIKPLILLANFYNVSTDFILCRTDLETEFTIDLNAQNSNMNNDYKLFSYIINASINLPTNQQQAIIDFCQSIIKNKISKNKSEVNDN